MTKHFKAPARFANLERKDEGGGEQLDTKKALGEFMGAFEEYKNTNDDRLKAIENGKTDPLAEEKLQKIDGFLNKYEDLNQKMPKAAKVADEVKKIEDRFDEIEALIKRGVGTGGGLTPEEKAADNTLWTKAVVGSILYGDQSLSDEQKTAMNNVIDSYKALNIGTNTEGGYLAPVEMIREIIKTETEISPVRSLARVRQTGLRSVELPKRTGQFAAQWVAEQGTKSETTGLTWGVEEVTTHELFALIDITNQMMEDTVFDIVSEIETESAEQFALAEGSSFVNGTGVGKPEGFMQNSEVGENNSGSAATIADADGQANGLITMKYSLKSVYAANASWLLNRTTMGSVRKLKDADKNYIWRPGIAQGQPNTIDGDTYVEMPDMPSEGAGNYPIAYGDFRRGYTWIDRLAMEFLRDPYTQATGGKIRYILRKRVAGKVTLPEAIKKLKCSA